MRIGLDATPLLGQMTGIGVYTGRVLRGLHTGWPDDPIVATAFTLRGRGELTSAVPAGVSVRARPVPARLLRAAWTAGSWPPVEWLAGPVDVFHATNFVLPPLGRAAGVLTVHDLAYLRFPRTVSDASLAYRELVPRGLSRAQMVLTPSAAVAEQLMDAYVVDPARLVVTPLGVEPEWSTAPRPTAAWLARHELPRPYLLAVGTLEPRKNLRALVRAYSLLLAEHPDVPDLVIAGGSGWGEPLDLSRIPSDRCRVVGYLPIEDLRTLVAGAQLLAFPSLDEGFGLPALEALACGTPVVANRLPVTQEVLGTHARYCSVHDAEEFAEALLAELTSSTGTPASRRAHAASFTWERCAALTHQAYRRAALEAGTSSAP